MANQLLSTFKLGPVELRNRIVFNAPGPAYGGLDDNANCPTPDLANYWGALARGGVGLMVTEPQSVHPTSTPNPRTIENTTDRVIEPYRGVADAIHDAGSRVFGHLWHAGLLGATGYRNLPLWAPSEVRAPMGVHVPAGGGAIAYAMTRDDVRTIVGCFAAAARRLREATFDGVEVDAAQGFLLSGFLSQKVNSRTDEYGGSLENRCRAVVEVLTAVREAIGPSLALGVRLSADPYIEPGITDADLPVIAGQLAKAGVVDYVSLVPALLPDSSAAEGVGAGTARAIHEASGLPVLYNGLLTDPDAAESLLAGGGIELAGMTRALLADPQLPAKVAQGRVSELRRCVGCNQSCSGLDLLTPYCILNPAPAEVDSLKSRPDGAGKRLLVIGAGLAGLESARLARMRGFEVTIWERGTAVGGQVNLAAAMPQRSRFAETVAFYERQMDAWGIELVLGKDATADAIVGFNPDAVIVATGATAVRPPWMKATNGHIVADIRDVLDGDCPALGPRVVIAMAEVDRGARGIAVAEALVDKGHAVTVVSPALEPCMNQDFYTSELAYRRVLAKGVRFQPLTEVNGVTEAGVQTVNIYTREAGAIEAEALITSYGSAAVDDLVDELEERGITVFAAGDCVAPRDMSGAIVDALGVMQKLNQVVRS